jgi:hypothetical protein
MLLSGVAYSWKRILFDENKLNGRLVATGMLYSQNAVRAEVTVHGRHEVIICAGHLDHLKP